MKRRNARAHITNQPTDRLKHTRVHGRTRKNREHNQAQLEKADNGTKDIDETCTSTLCQHLRTKHSKSLFSHDIANEKRARARAPKIATLREREDAREPHAVHVRAGGHLHLHLPLRSKSMNPRQAASFVRYHNGTMVGTAVGWA